MPKMTRPSRRTLAGQQYAMRREAFAIWFDTHCDPTAMTREQRHAMEQAFNAGWKARKQITLEHAFGIDTRHSGVRIN